ncbi:hypothetical protein FQA47_010251 [Oryzias melastigma]|uniref:Uncharacterized protein n=1 Tax=Oryzias melastigma TaxID=30732 RepID=A0A834FJ83_ORYME|nr:hypothetical protein FQA47_010251 [Oryzias melastigma]
MRCQTLELNLARTLAFAAALQSAAGMGEGGRLLSVYLCPAELHFLSPALGFGHQSVSGYTRQWTDRNLEMRSQRKKCWS